MRDREEDRFCEEVSARAGRSGDRAVWHLEWRWDMHHGVTIDAVTRLPLERFVQAQIDPSAYRETYLRLEIDTALDARLFDLPE